MQVWGTLALASFFRREVCCLLAYLPYTILAQYFNRNIKFTPFIHMIKPLRSNRTGLNRWLQKTAKTWITEYLMNKLCALLCVFSHELRPLAVYESAEGQAVPPGRGEVGHVHASVALSLLLTPGQQPAGSHLRLCVTQWNQLGPVQLVLCMWTPATCGFHLSRATWNTWIRNSQALSRVTLAANSGQSTNWPTSEICSTRSGVL